MSPGLVYTLFMMPRASSTSFTAVVETAAAASTGERMRRRADGDSFQGNF